MSLTIYLFIGDGAYSEVYKVKRNSDQRVYALKKVSRSHIHNLTDHRFVSTFSFSFF